MSSEIEKINPGEIMERVLLAGDIAKLTPADRASYYSQVCQSVGLNPLTKPFEYINLNGKLTLYAGKNCAEQLRRIYGVSVTITARDRSDDSYVVSARATDKNGRTDESIGGVPVKGLSGEALTNAFMKAETKAKRRVTLSICGLGMLDETEVESIPGAIRGVSEAPKSPNVIESWSVDAGQEFLREYDTRAKALTSFRTLASWDRQNAVIAEKLGVQVDFSAAVKRAFVLLAEKHEWNGELPENAPVDYWAAFAALNECQSLDCMVDVFKEHNPRMKGAGLEEEWKSYAGQEKARVKGAALGEVRDGL